MDQSENRKPLGPFNMKRLYSGRFLKKMGDRLAEGIFVIEGKKKLRVAILSMELGDNPFFEEIDIRFHLRNQNEPSGEKPIEWIKSISFKEETTKRNEQSEKQRQVFFFTFSNEISVEDNLNDFRKYIKDHVIRGANTPTTQA